MNYFKDYFNKRKYDDHFLSDQKIVYHQEINKWLKRLFELDESRYEHGKKDLVSISKRDAFLAEAMAIFYYDKELGANKFGLKASEPLDFTCKIDSENFFCEVKNPGWQGEVFKNSSLGYSEKTSRIKKLKYLSSQGGSYSTNDAIEPAIKNSISKFEHGKNNVVVICPNTFVTLHGEFPILIRRAIKSSVQLFDTEKLITQVDVLEIKLTEEGVVYCYQTYNISELMD